jgi:hypothetical protein
MRFCCGGVGAVWIAVVISSCCPPFIHHLEAHHPHGRHHSTSHLGVSTMPSYSLLRIMSSVCIKCFLLASTDAESCWLPARLEWMSSMRPLRYLVVTCGSG